MTTRRLPFFVYGTLRPGRCNHDVFLRGRTAAEVPARMRGAVLYEGPGYPYAVAAPPEEEVRGELITVAEGWYDAVLAALDELEEHRPGDPRSLYDRVAREVLPEGGAPVRAWVYLAAERVAHGLRTAGTRVPGGDWPG
ncbi:gamma-glutamylcyclotransferase family protein [Streptomyces sp. NPDC049577]|uniref:gamma-glutamylcyclotransferase family protein n=1 Tax=Streptomyces sp. NPDC049577 TaxID=3155153 RepID=UPI00343D24B7